MKDSNDITWICTDPDSNQYGRTIREGVYEFKEFDRNNYSINIDDYPNKEMFINSIFDNDEFWIQDTISLVDYNEPEIESHISAYYDSLEDLKEQYGDDWMFITAECIFEQESGLY